MPYLLNEGFDALDPALPAPFACTSPALATVSDGYLELQTGALYEYPCVYVDGYSHDGGYIGCGFTVEVAPIEGAYWADECGIEWKLDNSNAASVIASDGWLYLRLRDGGTATNVTLTYDPVEHRYWRVVEEDGSTLWQTSPNGSTWTTGRTEPTPAWASDSTVYPQLYAGIWDASSPGYTYEFGSFAVEVPDVAPPEYEVEDPAETPGAPEGGLPPSPEWPGAGVFARPPAYTFVLCDEAGRPRAELDDARSPRLSFVRNQAIQATMKLDLDAGAAYALARVLANGIPRLKVYRDGDLVLYGHWTPQRDQAGGEEDGSELTFRSPFARYEQAFTGHAGSAYEALSRDAGEIAWDLLAMYSLGLRRGTITPTKNRDRHYESKQIAEAVTQLTDVIDGFDFTETFVEDDPLVLAEFNVHPPSGEDRTQSAIFEYGEGTLENVRGVTRELRPPVNFVRVVGEEGAYAEALDQPSIDRYGHYGKVLTASSGTVEQATLQDRADAELRPTLQRVISFEPDPELSPRPWRDYDPVRGDLVAVRAREGALIVSEAVRVNGLEIALDDEGNEATHTLLYEQEGEFLPDETGFPPEVGEEGA